MDIFTPIPKPTWPPRWRNVSGGVTPRVWGMLFALGLAMGLFQVVSLRADERFLRSEMTGLDIPAWVSFLVCLGVGAIFGVLYYGALYWLWISYGPFILIRKLFFLALLPFFGGIAVGIAVAGIALQEPLFMLGGTIAVTAWLVLLTLCLGQDAFSRPYEPPPSEEDRVQAKLDAVLAEHPTAPGEDVGASPPLEQIVPIVREVILAWNPYQLATDGDPSELEPEIHALAKLAPQMDSPLRTAEAVSRVFSTSFDDPETFSLEQCRDVGQRLYSAIHA